MTPLVTVESLLSDVALLLLVRSQLYHWGPPILGEIFAHVTFFDPTIEVVTFRLRGWYILGVFLLPAFTRLGHEYQDLLSMCSKMLVCDAQTRPQFILLSESFWEMESESKGKVPSTRSTEEDQTHDAASHRIASPTH